MRRCRRERRTLSTSADNWWQTICSREGCHARHLIGIRPPLFEAYGLETSIIVDIGACNINGTVRDVCPRGAPYLSLHMAPGPGVDVVIKPNGALPLASASVDIVVSTSTFAHDPFLLADVCGNDVGHQAEWQHLHQYPIQSAQSKTVDR